MQALDSTRGCIRQGRQCSQPLDDWVLQRPRTRDFARSPAGLPLMRLSTECHARQPQLRSLQHHLKPRKITISTAMCHTGLARVGEMLRYACPRCSLCPGAAAHATHAPNQDHDDFATCGINCTHSGVLSSRTSKHVRWPQRSASKRVLSRHLSSITRRSVSRSRSFAESSTHVPATSCLRG
jgi:hypothetical protein